MENQGDKHTNNGDVSTVHKDTKNDNDSMKKRYDELRKLYVPATPFRKFIYDLILWAFCVVFDCFFRDIRSRGGFKVPKEDPVIFVAAPHANQFVDPIILMSQVKKASNRRVHCLIAEKSHRRKFIGLVSRSQLAIPVKRAQDNLKNKNGLIKLDPNNELHIIGENTNFLKDCESKGLIALPNSLGTAVIENVVSDTELFLKKPFKYSSKNAELKAKEIFKTGANFKSAEKIDQSEVYAQVFEHLSQGNCIGVFSEGGSHDRPGLLPLKAGVALMALGAMDATPGLNVKIVPVGMNYFHAHKFRSRALVEFGHPIEIDEKLLSLYSNSNSTSEAVKILLEKITKGVESVTLSCPDFESLSVIQAARRLYSNNFSQKLSTGSIVEMNRRLLNGYLHFKDDPKIKNLSNEILHYNELLKINNIPDHLVGNIIEKSKISLLFELIIASIKIFFLTLLALPGIFLFSPVFIATKKISEKKRREALAGSTVKIKGNDVIATWKILVSMGFAPILYTIYSIIGIKFIHYYNPNISRILSFIIFYMISVTITYCALIFGDKGMDLYKQAKSLWLLITNKRTVEDLKNKRDKLSLEITETINFFGPKLYPDFNIIDYDKKSKTKQLLKKQRMKNQINLTGLTEEEELEELKTFELRQRRLKKKQERSNKNNMNNNSNIDTKFQMTQDTPILNASDDMSSSTESSSISITSDGESVTSDSEYNSNSSKSQMMDMIREKIIKENREREA